MPWHVLGTLSQTVPKFFLGVVSASTLIAVLVLPAQAQTKSLIPVPRIQFLSTSGVPLANSHVHTYISLTTTAQATYTDSGGGTANANPVVLDGGGFASIWLTPGESYTIAVHNSSDVQQYSIDQVTSGTLDTNLVVGTTAVTFTSTPTFNSATSVYFSITLTGNVTSSTLSNAIDGRVAYFNICQDGTGDRTFTWPASVLTPPTVGTAASSCTSASFIYDGTNWREIAPSSRGSITFDSLVPTATGKDICSASNRCDAFVQDLDASGTVTGIDGGDIDDGATASTSALFSGGAGAASFRAITAADVPNLENLNGTLDVASGGTGQSTATAAFDALDPLTTKGDVLVNNGTNSVRLAVGTNNQVLTADSAQASGVKWAAAAGGGLGYALVLGADGVNFTDATTYYFGSIHGQSPNTTAAIRRMPIPKAGNIVRFDLFIRVGGTLPTSEQITYNVRLNNASDSFSITTSLEGGIRQLSATGSTSVVAGDYIEIKIVTPTWATNPTLVRHGAVIFIE